MKPAPFEYVRPTTLAEACRILAQDEDARVLAGGQTLIPLTCGWRGRRCWSISSASPSLAA